MSVYPVILAGGEGRRVAHILGPLPKQFAPIPAFQGRSMLENTYERLQLSTKIQCKPLIAVNAKHYDFFLDNYKRDNFSTIMVENETRNTGYAVTMAIMKIYSQDCNAKCLFLPIDQKFVDDIKAITSLEQMIEYTNHSLLVVVIEAITVNQNYGNVFPQHPIPARTSALVDKFSEKPSEIFKSDAIYWSTGILYFKAASYLDLLRRLNPEYYRECIMSFKSSKAKDDVMHLQPSALIPSLPVERIIMEQCKELYAWNLGVHWEDLGSEKTLMPLMYK